ncbi:MAG: acyltransferase [Spirulina sp. DLM2.Bin59]|nr:MAG: acyltransferase [Spirulina sp. DLM2.Bin59]
MDQSVTTRPRGPRFSFLDALRGLASVWVVLYHAAAGEHTPLLEKTLPHWLFEVLFRQGYLGVPVFFVLSGFVLSYTTRNLKISWPLFQNAIVRRWVRLSPPYYISIALFLLVTLLKTKVDGSLFWMPSWDNLLAHLVYLQVILDFKTISTVYWALCIEVQFFLVYFALMALGQGLDRISPRMERGLDLVVMVAAAIALLWPLNIVDHHWLTEGLFFPYWHGFLLGALAYRVYSDRLWGPWLYSYGGCILAAGLVHQHWFSVIAVIVTLGITVMGHYQQLNCLNWRWLQFLGLISYSLYITHPAISRTSLFLGRRFLDTNTVWGEGLNVAIHLLVCIGFAALFWYVVERPSVVWSQRLRRSPTITSQT